MGVGKSTIGKALAYQLDVDFIDLDNYIQQKEGKSILDLFKNDGEISFRRKETDYLNKVLNQSSSFVLSLGGGTPCYANNMELINKYANYSVYLKASFQFLSKRLYNQQENRPLLQHLQSLEDYEDFIRKHLFERQNYYFLANTTINVEQKQIDSIVTELINELNLN